MKKKIIYLSFILVLVISLITLSSIYKLKDNKYKKEYNTIPKGMAIMIKEEGTTDYIKSTSKDIPKGNYVLNRVKSYCKNNGKIGNYDSSLGKVSFSFIGTDSCYLYFDYKKETIKLGSTELVVNSEVPDFNQISTTNEGLFKADDDYTATTGMKSYYFRGAVDNNWVKYGKYTKNMYNCNNGILSSTDTGNSCTKIASKGDDMYWRIIRINGDNSIRMIYSGITPPTESTKVIKTTDTSLGNSPFNKDSNSAEYVGYMYTIKEQHGTSKSSDIKTFLDNWYANYTDLNKTGTKITDQIYCNDRTSSTSDVAYSTTNYTTLTSWNSTGTQYYYGAYGRVWNSPVSPDYKCPTASDKFTVNISNGNGALTYPVGLITADEVAMAGGTNDTDNSSYYLYTNQNYWSGSPYYFYSSYADEFQVYSSGTVDGSNVEYADGVRPVISLSSKAKLLGSGTYDDVYTVVGGNSTEDTPSGKSFDTVFAVNNTDIFNENGIRYEGADPNNYICLDNKASGACSDSSLLFRIIGLFDEDTSSDGTNSSGTKKLLKVIDTNNYGGMSWDDASLKNVKSSINSSEKYKIVLLAPNPNDGTNDWSSATLKTKLNGTYLTTLLGTSNVNSKLSSAIANTKWHLGGTSNSNEVTFTADSIYAVERNTSAIYSGNPSSIYAKVGLMYPSDYGYATVGGSTTNKTGCRNQSLYNWNNSSYSDCKNNDWLFTSQVTSWGSNESEWLLSPYSSTSYIATQLFYLGNVSNDGVGTYNAVRPTIYLDSSTLKIVGTGDGSSTNPYRIG